VASTVFVQHHSESDFTLFHRDAVFEGEFRGMTLQPTTVRELEQTRTRMIARIHEIVVRDGRSPIAVCRAAMPPQRFDYRSYDFLPALRNSSNPRAVCARPRFARSRK
jgi:hypothetical protein